MKKIAIPVLILIFASSLHAQDILRSKKGFPILPQKGDWGISFDAVPFLEYAGNLFNGSNNAPDANFGRNSPMTFSGLYIKNESTAYRAKIRLGLSSAKSDTLVQKLGSTNPNETVADETKTTSTRIVLGAGIQKWKGNARLKGIYGVEGLISVSTGKTTYTYGNELSNQNQIQDRVTSEKEGSGFGFQIRGFLGVEYFFAPKMSVSAEYGWGPSINSTGSGEVQKESWNGSGVDSSVKKTGKTSSFGFDVDNAGGALNLSFYF